MAVQGSRVARQGAQSPDSHRPAYTLPSLAARTQPLWLSSTSGSLPLRCPCCPTAAAFPRPRDSRHPFLCLPSPRPSVTLTDLLYALLYDDIHVYVFSTDSCELQTLPCVEAPVGNGLESELGMYQAQVFITHRPFMRKMRLCVMKWDFINVALVLVLQSWEGSGGEKNLSTL